MRATSLETTFLKVRVPSHAVSKTRIPRHLQASASFVGRYAFLLACLLATGCVDPEPQTAPDAPGASDATAAPDAAAAHHAPTAPNALLITMDTLRADHIAPYGDATSRTPTMQRLASEGTLFENAMSPMQMTRPSHGSLLTSLYPRDHGVVNNKIALDSQFRSLAQVFHDAGYATAAFTAVKLLAPGSGLEHGFDHFDAPREARTRDARAVIDAAEQWLQARPAPRPFFVWVHLFDPHTPYAPPEDLRPAAGPGPGGDLVSAGIEEMIELARSNGNDLPRSAVDRAKALYRGDIEYADRELGRLFTTLERDALLDRTAVVLTADHGECFENGIYFEHSDCLYEGAARIPLIFRFGDHVATGQRRDDVVEILDVAPTLLSLVGLEVPEAFLGRRLFDASSKEREAAFLQHPLYSNVGAKNRSVRRLSRVMGEPTLPLVVREELLGVRTRKWKYLRRGNHEELYDLERDPQETRNIAAAHPDVTEALHARLEAWSNAHPQHQVQTEQINDEMRATLEALGYVR